MQGAQLVTNVATCFDLQSRPVLWIFDVLATVLANEKLLFDLHKDLECTAFKDLYRNCSVGGKDVLERLGTVGGGGYPPSPGPRRHQKIRLRVPQLREHSPSPKYTGPSPPTPQTQIL